MKLNFNMNKKQSRNEIKLVKKELIKRIQCVDPVEDSETYDALLERLEKVERVQTVQSEARWKWLSIGAPIFGALVNAGTIVGALAIKSNVENGGKIFSGDKVIEKHM